MFSSRIPWDTPHNRFSQVLADKRARGAPLLDLTESNPTRVGLFGDLDPGELLAPLGDRRGLAYAPSPRGLLTARQAVASYYAGRGLAVDPEHLVLCASTSEAYSWLFQLLCDVDDRVLHPQPSYPLFQHLAGLCSVRLLPYGLDYDGRWRVDLPALCAACENNDEARAILLVNPNNPTGSFLCRGELDEVLDLCRERRLALIADEVFSDYRLGEDPGEATGREALVTSLIGAEGTDSVLCFVLSGLSKVLGLPQLKLGWIHVSGPETLRRAAQDRLELIADTFLSVGTPVQLAAPALLRQRPRLGGAIAHRVLENHAQLSGLLRDTACQLLRAEGGWYGVVRLPRLLDEEEWVLTLLGEDEVVCYPGYFFDFPEEAYLVLSLLPEPAILREGVGRILGRVKAL